MWDRVYPRVSLPEPELEAGLAPNGLAAGYLVSRVVIRFDWKDRLRILVSGRVEVQVQTTTDVFVRAAVSKSVVNVLPPGA